ncbi:hypothetical protein [Halorientalis litorea]|uniref:hypothetical protein n=1 Tax=Halorientalis litorea TaxID=2931977 RepID=UPI001FF2E41A|nr:hypothetical protein [Halorientalis litorea]
MNRRNILAGMGALAIGGGGLLGSGAFTSVEAERTVEVNVIGPDEVTNATEDVDALTDEYVDVRVDAAFSTVFIDSADGTTTTDQDETTLNPTSSAEVVSSHGASDTEVSLIANDVTLRFGADDGGLPQDSTINYDDLFVIDSSDIDGNADGADYDVTLETTNNKFLNIADNGTQASGDASGDFPTTTIGGDSGRTVLNSNVDTTGISNASGSSPDDSDTLTIRIEPTP